MSDWQPIETAPRDGIAILGYWEWAGEINGIDHDKEIAIIFWSGGRTDYPGFEWVVRGTDAYAAWLRPTHWMPLPPPPLTER